MYASNLLALSGGMIFLICIVAGMLLLLLVILMIAYSTYNGLVTAQERYKNQWSQIDVQLRRRHDLISPLVEPVEKQGFVFREIAPQVLEQDGGRKLGAIFQVPLHEGLPAFAFLARDPRPAIPGQVDEHDLAGVGIDFEEVDHPRLAGRRTRPGELLALNQRVEEARLAYVRPAQESEFGPRRGRELARLRA